MIVAESLIAIILVYSNVFKKYDISASLSIRSFVTHNLTQELNAVLIVFVCVVVYISYRPILLLFQGS